MQLSRESASTSSNTSPKQDYGAENTKPLKCSTVSPTALRSFSERRHLSFHQLFTLCLCVDGCQHTESRVPLSVSLRVSRLKYVSHTLHVDIFRIQSASPTLLTDEQLIWVKTFKLLPQMVLQSNPLRQPTHQP